MKLLLPVLLAVLSCGQVFCQNNWNNWYFGNYVGLNFSPAPTPVSGGQTTQLEGVACISDNNGNLLFYTDGRYVWDRTHNFMPNGGFDPFNPTAVTLGGGWSASQSALIVPIPGQPQRYYLFTVTEWDESGNLTVSVINMALNGGLGDVETAGKNQLLATLQTEKLVSATATGCGVWVISHQRGTNTFESRLVSATGIAAPVYSSVGSVHTSGGGDNLIGVMKVSRDNQNIALGTRGGIIELFRFDAATGVVSDPIHINTTLSGYGVCFSPDNSKLYITEGIPNVAGYDISQFDLSTYTAAAVNSSRTYIGRATTPQSYVFSGDMQAAPDGRIYFTKSESYYLGCIPFPNLPAPLCGFIDNGLYLGGQRGLFGLPNEVRYADTIHELDMGRDTALCLGESMVLQAPPSPFYTWSNGETGDQITVTQAGNYWVKISDGVCFASDTIMVDFRSLPDFDLGNDTTLCSGDRLRLSAPLFGDAMWSTGATDPFIEVSFAGTYWLAVNQNGCKKADTLNVHLDSRPVLELGNDTTICPGSAVLLTGGIADAYLWSTGSQVDHETISREGLVWLRIDKGVCTAADSMLIQFYPTPLDLLPKDTAGCIDVPLSLHAGIADSYLWSTGDTGATLKVRQPGLYSVDVRFGNDCFVRYSTAVAFSNCSCVCDVPNAFTPNGDGKNDLFLPARRHGCNFLRFAVFNRWGQKVYETTDLDRGWRGQLNGQPLDTGTYAWQIIAEDGGQVRIFKGFVVLIR